MDQSPEIGTSGSQGAGGHTRMLHPNLKHDQAVSSPVKRSSESLLGIRRPCGYLWFPICCDWNCLRNFLSPCWADTRHSPFTRRPHFSNVPITLPTVPRPHCTFSPAAPSYLSANDAIGSPRTPHASIFLTCPCTCCPKTLQRKDH